MKCKQFLTGEAWRETTARGHQHTNTLNTDICSGFQHIISTSLPDIYIVLDIELFQRMDSAIA